MRWRGGKRRERAGGRKERKGAKSEGRRRQSGQMGHVRAAASLRRMVESVDAETNVTKRKEETREGRERTDVKLESSDASPAADSM